MENMNVADCVVDVLAKNGVTDAFGIPRWSDFRFIICYGEREK